MLQRLTQRAALPATIRTGQFVPVSEALVQRPQDSLRELQHYTQSRRHAAALDGGTSLQVVRLAPASHEELPTATELPAHARTAVGWSSTGSLLGAAFRYPLPDGSGPHQVSSRFLDVERGRWSADCSHSRVDSHEIPSEELLYSTGDRYAACTFGTQFETSRVLVLAVNTPVWELLSLQLGKLVDFAWARSGQVLVLVFREGVFTISVSLCGQANTLRTACRWVALPGLTVWSLDQCFSGPELSLAVINCTEAQAVLQETKVQAGMARLVIEGAQGTLLQSVLLEDWESREYGPAVSSEADSLVLHCNNCACVRTRYRNMSYAWTVPGLTASDWNLYDGHFLAGIKDSAVVVFDRAGSTVATWKPVLSHDPLAELKPLSVFTGMMSPC